MKEDQFLRDFTSRQYPELILFLGAGSSKSSGIPTAWELTWYFKRDIYCSTNTVSQEALRDVTLPNVQKIIQDWIAVNFPVADSNEYAFFFEKAYPTSQSRKRIINKYVSDVSVSIGYLCLGALIKNNKIRNLITTNFDSLVEKVHPDIFVVSDESSHRAGDLEIAGTKVQLIKLHGDFRYDKLRNTSKEIQQINNEIQSRLKDFFKEFGIIVVGYNGRDDSIMAFFEELAEEKNIFPKGFYWCIRKEDTPNERVSALVSKLMAKNVDAGYIEIESFDDFLVHLYRQTGIKDETIEKTIKETKDIPPEDIDKKSESEKREGEESTPFGKLLRSIMESNEEGEKTALDERLREDSDEYERVKTKGIYYWMRYKYGNKDVLEDLIKLSKENPDHPNPHLWLGNLYKEYKQFDKAHAQFMRGQEFTKNDSEKTTFVCNAAKALIEDGKLKEAKELIIERIRSVSNNSTNELFELYHTLSLIQKRSTNTECYLSLAEKALELKPSDSSTRFDLAYTYSKSKNHIMALYHYKILCNSTPNDANWNNLGVELSELELSGKSVEAYLKSKELGGTTSIGNLAYKLIDIGFYGEAKKYIQEALDHYNCSSNVSSTLSSLESKKNEEDDREQELLLDVSSRIRFRVKYAEAFIEPFEAKLTQIWKSKYGNVDIKIEGNRFVAKGERKIEPALSMLGSYNPYRKRTSDEEMILQKITYQGTIVNRTIDYELMIYVEPVRKLIEPALVGSLLGTKKEMDVHSGMMVINRECNKIEVMEKDPKGNVSFYEMTSNDTR